MRRPHNTASVSEQEDAILEAAIEEIELAGMARASLDVVARQAGVSRSTLYRRFPNREALLSAVAPHFRDRADPAAHHDADPAAFPPARRRHRRRRGRVRRGRRVPHRGRPHDGRRAAGGGDARRRPAGGRRTAHPVGVLAGEVPTPSLDIADDDAVRAYAARHLAPLVWRMLYAQRL